MSGPNRFSDRVRVALTVVLAAAFLLVLAPVANAWPTSGTVTFKGQVTCKGPLDFSRGGDSKVDLFILNLKVIPGRNEQGGYRIAQPLTQAATKTFEYKFTGVPFKKAPMTVTWSCETPSMIFGYQRTWQFGRPTIGDTFTTNFTPNKKDQLVCFDKHKNKNVDCPPWL